MKRWIYIVGGAVTFLVLGVVIYFSLSTSSSAIAMTKGELKEFTEILDMTPETLDKEVVHSVFREAKDMKLNIELPNLEIVKAETSIQLNPKYSEEFVEANLTLYKVVAHYFSRETFSGTEFADYADPLFLMALANVENGSITSPDVLLAPALPTKLGVKATRENILTFGYSDYLNYPKVLRSDRKAFRGPFQIMTSSFVAPIIPEEIVGSEYLQLISADPTLPAVKEEMLKLGVVEGSGVSSRVDGTTVRNSSAHYGDRFNFADATNRVSGYLKHQWLKSNSDCVATNKYSWMAISAIGHNSSPGIYSMSNESNLNTSKYYWWPYESFGAARSYCEKLSSEENVLRLRTAAEEAVKVHRAGGSLKFKLSRREGFELANQLVPGENWKTTLWNHEEKIAYPVQVLYNYFVLEAIYKGV